MGWSASVERRLGQLALRRDFGADPDPVDAVHELRVASRRLRALAAAVEPVVPGGAARRVERLLARLTHAVAEKREWDVTALDVERRREARPPAEQAGVAEVQHHVAARRQRAAERARERVAQLDLARIELGFRELRAGLALAVQARGEPAVVAASLAAPLRAIRRAWPDGSTVDDARVHTFRIRTKQLRYAVEIAELSTPGFSALRRDLTHLQELLGAHHDLVVLTALVAKRRDKLEGDAEMRRALDAWRRSLAEERDQLRDRAREAWTALARDPIEARVARVLSGSVDAAWLGG